MSYNKRIRNARSNPEAFAILAEGIDKILAKLDEQPAQDPWSDGWPQDPESQPVHVPGANFDVPVGTVTPALRKHWQDIGLVQDDDVIRPSPNSEAIAACLKALETEADPEVRMALEARLRLLQDDGGIIPNYVPGAPVKVEYNGDLSTVELEPASPERQAARRLWAMDHKLETFFPRVPVDDLYEGFAKGGPLWLYLTEEGRDALLAMPVEWRSALVNDLELDNPRVAQDVGRDLLKQDEAIDPGTATEHLERIVGTLGDADA